MYGKLFSQTFTGSMYGKGATVFAVWGYVVSNARRNRMDMEGPGTVELNPDMLAPMIGTTVQDIQGAIEYLCAPDPQSRTKDYDGRRLIRQGQFLYAVPNLMKYRGVKDDEERRAQDRDRKQRQRDREAAAAGQTPAAPGVTPPPAAGGGNGKGEHVEIPDWLDAKLFRDFMATRKAAARRPQAQLAAIEKLAKFKGEGHDPNAIVRDALANGWSGLFAPDRFGAKGGAAAGTQPPVGQSQAVKDWLGGRTQ